MGAQHRLDAVGDQLAAGERILHADMAHGDAVVDADGVELERNPAGRVDRFAHFLADHIQMGVARNDLHERIADRDKRLVEVRFGFHNAGRSQQAAVRGADHPFLIVSLMAIVGIYISFPRSTSLYPSPSNVRPRSQNFGVNLGFPPNPVSGNR